MSNFDREKYPAFIRIIDLISAQNPLQRKRIETFVTQQDATYWKYAEQVSRALERSVLVSESARIEAASAYNRMCMDFLREQIHFRKTGVYRLDDAQIAQAQVYDRPDVMRYYMIGLLWSYLLWRNHYAMLRLLQAHLDNISVEHYLEIAPGHGLFASETLRRHPHLNAILIDLSETSIQITRDILAAFQIDPARTRFVHGDFGTTELPSDKFDLIVMGEILEHINQPLEFMRKARQLLSSQGTIFMTTCANCPAIDHVYHFHTVNEIRAAIREAGLTIVREISLPAEDIPEARWQVELVTINYAAILTERNG